MAVRATALIPAYNEADVIAGTIQAALAIPGVDEVIVGDDGSSDGTSEAARQAGAHKVLRLDRNSGKGDALNAIRQHASGEVLLLLDADLGPSAAEGAKLLAPVLNGEADMAIGILCAAEAIEGSDGVPTLKPRSGGFGLVVKTARFGIKALGGQRMAAPLAGPRAVRREIVEKAGGFESKFGVEVALTIDALRMGSKVIEVPVQMVHRASGRDFRGFLHRGGQLIDVVRALGNKALKR
jgi:glycosyltransferase involved in cell wall biosynthesis